MYFSIQAGVKYALMPGKIPGSRYTISDLFCLADDYDFRPIILTTIVDVMCVKFLIHKPTYFV